MIAFGAINDSVTTTFNDNETSSTRYYSNTTQITVITTTTFYRISQPTIQEEKDDCLDLKQINAGKSKWILREGMKIEINTRQTPKDNVPLRVPRMMRCNRKGIGLRVRVNK